MNVRFVLLRTSEVCFARNHTIHLEKQAVPYRRTLNRLVLLLNVSKQKDEWANPIPKFLPSANLSKIHGFVKKKKKQEKKRWGYSPVHAI